MMKKRTVYYLLLICLLAASLILVADYFRATFVSEKGEREEQKEFPITEEPLPAINEDVKEEVKISVFGDNLIHESILKYANTLAGGNGNRESYSLGFDFLPLYEHLSRAISDSDFAIINQASLVGANDRPESLSGYPLFNTPGKMADDLIALGFDGVNIANNHALDMTGKGYEKSVLMWKQKDITLLGGYLSEEEKSNISEKIIRIGEFDVAILSYTATTNGLSSSSGSSIPYYTLNDSAILRKMLLDEVSFAKDHSDAVLVLMNWGNGQGYDPGENQKETAQILCDAGADLIVGTGPKVIQPIEKLVSQDGAHETVCAYSLGNVMCTMEYMENLLGGYLTFELERENGICMITNVCFHPTVIHYDENISNIAVFPLEEYSREKYETHGSNALKGKGNFAWFENTLKKYISEEFLN